MHPEYVGQTVGSKDVEVKDQFVPEHRTLAVADTKGGPTPGSAVNPGPLFQMPVFALFPYMLSGVALGIAEGLIDQFAQGSVGRGKMTGVKIAGVQSVQLRLGEAAAFARASRLFQVATEAGLPDAHRRAAKQIEAVLPAITGKTLVMNVSAAIPAVLLDAGFPLGALKGVPLLARTASLVAHLLEEQSKPIGFVLSHAASKAIDYDGPVPEGFVRGDT